MSRHSGWCEAERDPVLGACNCPASTTHKVRVDLSAVEAAVAEAGAAINAFCEAGHSFTLISGKLGENCSIPMILTCPVCCERHIDEEKFAEVAHHTHACQGCGFVWRPAKVNTHGVQFLPGYRN